MTRKVQKNLQLMLGKKKKQVLNYEVVKFVYLFIVDEHGSVKGFCCPVNKVGGVRWCHVDQYTL